MLSSRSNFVIALTAVHGSAFAGFEWYFSVLATFRANYGIHLAWGSIATIATVSVTLGLSRLPACRTALGVVSVAFGCEKLLLLNTEAEISSTVGALESFFFKAHG